MGCRNDLILASLIVMAMLLANSISAEEAVTLGTANSSLSLEAQQINSSLSLLEKDMEKMAAEGFRINRYNDTLTEAYQLFEIQAALEKNGMETDYTRLYDKIGALTELKQNAYQAMDELKALELAINQSKIANLSLVLEIYDNAESELNSERYENCILAIDKAYKKMSELEAIQTKLKAFYEATSRGVWNFIKERWEIILAVTVLVIVLYLITYPKIKVKVLSVKIDRLERRKVAITNLIAKTQKDYFEEGKIPETVYLIRTKKYSEMIRDINRQIPLLREEIELTKKKRKETSNKKL